MCILNTAMIMTHILISATNHLPSRWSAISAYRSFSICIRAEYSRSLAHSLVSRNFLCWKKLIWNGIVVILQWLYDCPVKFGGCFSHSYLWMAVLRRLTLAAALSVTDSDSQTEAGLWCLCYYWVFFTLLSPSAQFCLCSKLTIYPVACVLVFVSQCHSHTTTCAIFEAQYMFIFFHRILLHLHCSCRGNMDLFVA